MENLLQAVAMKCVNWQSSARPSSGTRYDVSSRYSSWSASDGKNPALSGNYSTSIEIPGSRSILWRPKFHWSFTTAASTNSKNSDGRLMKTTTLCELCSRCGHNQPSDRLSFIACWPIWLKIKQRPGSTTRLSVWFQGITRAKTTSRCSRDRCAKVSKIASNISPAKNDVAFVRLCHELWQI